MLGTALLILLCIITEHACTFAACSCMISLRQWSNPQSTVVRKWIENIRCQLGIMIQYTDRLHKVLVRWANHLKEKTRCLKEVHHSKGSFRRIGNYNYSHKRSKSQQLMQQKIDSPLQQVSASAEQLDSLQSKNRKLEYKVCLLSDKEWKIGTQGKSKTKHCNEYSQSHQW